MQRQSNQNTALALTALIMTVGTSVHAQFQFLTDQPLNASDTARRNSRNDEGDAPPRPAARGYAAPEPEKKGFFGRLFSRDAEPARSQPQPGYYDRRETTAPPAGYAQPGTAYVRDGVRFSDPAGYNQSPAAAAPQAYDPPTGNARPLQTHVVSDGVRYAPGAEPAVNYSIPAAPRTAAGGDRRAATFDPFSGQRPVRSESIAPAAQDFPVAQPQGFQPQWPQAQVVAPQYPPQDYAPPSWPNASDPRVIGAQAVATGETAVVPPSGTPRPLTSHVVSEGVRYAPGAVPDGYPAPAPRYQPPARNEPLDRPGFFSRLFGRGSGEPAPARVYPPAAGAADSRRIYDDPTMRPLPAQNHPVQPAPEFNQRSRSIAPQPPAGAPQQDPFSGQRPTRRSNEYVPEVPESFPQGPAPRSSLDAPPFAPSAPLPGNLSPAEERMFQPGVKPEDRRYLMYLYAKTGRADMAEPLAQDILARDPANKEALLAMSSLFVDKKDAGRALAYATQLYQAHPDSNDALYYYGAANQLAGNYDEAAGVLRFLRLEKFTGRPFPYQLDLAGASEKTGNWRGQMTAYQELLDQNQVDDQTRVMVRRVLEPMQREHGDNVSVQGTAYLLKSGDLWQERVGGRTQVSDRDQLYVDAAREDVLVRSSTLLKRRWADDTEGWLGWQANWSRRWTSDLWAGAYQDGALGGARLTHRLPSNGAVWLEGFANERARDGLLLNSLDGRQHRLTLAGNYLIAGRFQTYGALTGREVMVNGTELAAGLQGSWGVEFLARRESPEFKLGYRGTYDANSRKTGNLALVAPAAGPGTTAAQQAQVLDSLVLHWLHREGIYADLRDRLWGPFFYHLQGSADYAFERDSPEFGGRAGLVFQPRKSLEFDTEVAYSTSAATTDGGSDAWELGVSMKWWF
ncbi:MAG: hypothetical protein WCS99_01305 [Limisphaerales bacterium]